MKPKTIVVAVLVILFLILALQNTQSVTLRFFFWTVAVSRIILIPFFMFLGFMIGYIVAKMEKRSGAAPKENQGDPE
jgi:uncharacterized integral membrane protein